MKKIETKIGFPVSGNDKTKPDKDADKSGTDRDSDKTEPEKDAGKYDKPKRETDPDKTEIDTTTPVPPISKENISKQLTNKK